MRFLIDNALPPRLAVTLRDAGHDAQHVRDYCMQAARDELVLARALEESRIVVSADTDFGTLLAGMEASKPSFILFRDSDVVAAEDYARMLIEALPVLEADLMRGCVVVFRPGRLRVRKLPIG